MRVCLELQEEKVSPSTTYQVHSNDCPRATSTSQPPPESRLSQLEEENRSLRLRLAGSSSGPLGHDLQKTNQDALPVSQANPSSIFSSQPSSSVASTPSWSGDRLAEGGKGRPSEKTHSALFGLTSASVLEDTPGNFGEAQAHFPTGSFPAESKRLSQQLETEAAKQRASSP